MASAPIEPLYPVRDASPSPGKVIANFRGEDFLTIAGITGVAAPFGYYLGKPIAVPTMRLAGLIGACGGFLLAFQNSSGRLMGYRK
mmetsp:Transcript_15068/g.17053  ORF Transcript_15068/g.17053 Transcript_15068/m.17053 type:complete len:86 (+) Transcript_15068:192-449(+)|eukprot:CAMPEP_0184015218 /NCGR_PEP_ID=MMETSP0954-20121128/6168_1 /TAXON_ID=627963 /ORGANISM="Aplanochytrium sp, Strain PBS07" /LENGTH=85 /DNA_ID=CAMNT_0026295937 /DNA_START=178 /DNA_END=435 /DNA_ORIENTATION=+